MSNQSDWVVEGKGLSRDIAGKLLVHCFIVIFFGFAGGFVWVIALADNVFHILPLPRLEVLVPDQKELLRNAHVGPIMNSMYVIGIVAISPWLNFSVRQAKWLYCGAIATLWGNLIGYSAAVFTPMRGLQPIFENDWPNLLAYFSFYIAIISVTATTGICLTNALRAARSR